MKITFLINQQNQTINLQDSIVTNNYNFIYVKKAHIFWEYHNIEYPFTALSNNGTVINMYPGYYRFEDIQNLFWTGATLDATKYNGKCKITTDVSTTINITTKLATLLGFAESNRAFNPGTTTQGDGLVNINLGLKYVKIRCNLIDQLHNINELGSKDDTLISLPITTDKSLFGSVQSYTDIESKLRVVKGVTNQISLSVTDQDGNPINVGRILLECYLV